YSNSSVYQAPSGAWVFGAGTFGWTWALDDFLNGANKVDPRIQQTTANILNRFLGPGPDFTLSAAPSSRTLTEGRPTSYAGTVSPARDLHPSPTLRATDLSSDATGDQAPSGAWVFGAGTFGWSWALHDCLNSANKVGPRIQLTPANTLNRFLDPAPDFTLSA